MLNSTRWTSTVIPLWIALLAIGCLSFEQREWKGSVSTPVPNDGSSRSRNGSELVVFLHPHCPCSGASVDALASLMNSANTTYHKTVYLFCPSSQREEWTHGSLESKLRGWDDVAKEIDWDGQAAERAGVRVSGTVQFRDAMGQLRFSGGVTNGRNRRGPSVGLDSLTHQMTDPTNPILILPVFGCEIRPASRERT